jgi:hypothetical protein
MPRIVQPPNLLAIIKDLQKRISILENTARLTASSIRTNGNSALKVLPATGTVPIAATGDVPLAGGGTAPGFATYRPNGQPALISVASTPFQMALIDAGNHVVVSTNETTGYGLGYPLITFPMYAIPTALLPSTAAGSDTLLWTGSVPQSHSYFDLVGQAAVSGGATGVITLVVGGTTIGSITITSAGFNVWAFNSTPTAGSPSPAAYSGVNVYGRISAGAGTLYIAVTTGLLHG